jgi:hypothetical protein
MLMKIPDDARIIEMPTSLLWVDKRGVLSVIPKEDAPAVRPMNEIRSEMEELRKILGHKKVCIVMEAGSNSESPPKEQRDFIAEQISSITRAMAIITSSPLSRMVANLFFSFKPPPYPYKIFSNEKDAREWIEQYV